MTNCLIKRWYEWDVTSFVQSQKAAGVNMVTVAVSMAATSANPDLFNSKEAGANGPQLLISGSSGEGVTYEWDAANRLVVVNESATLRSEFSYDGLDRRVKIVEKNNGTVTSTRQLIWCGSEICEERNASNVVTKRYFPQGVQLSGANYFYTKDHLGSIRELTDSTGAVRARYDYDPWGRRSKLSGDLEADFGFTGHYFHQPSGLHLALYRGYDAGLGRWLNRDPIEEKGGINL